MSCDEYDRSTAKILHVEQSILYLFISTEKQRILLCRNLEFKEAEWELKFVNEESGEQDIENITMKMSYMVLRLIIMKHKPEQIGELVRF